MMGIEEAIKIINGVLEDGNAIEESKLVEAVSIAEWCMKHAKHEFEGRSWRNGCIEKG